MISIGVSFVAVLDPRCKMSLVEYAFPNLFKANDATKNIEMVRDALYVIFEDYARTSTSNVEKSLVGYDQGEGPLLLLVVGQKKVLVLGGWDSNNLLSNLAHSCHQNPT